MTSWSCAKQTPAGPKRRLLFVAVLAAVFCAGGACAVHASEPLLNRPAPHFARQSLSGEKIDLADYRGKVVLLNFWATWCVPCRIELPRFDAWQAKYGRRGLAVVAVSMDDDPAQARRVVQKLHLGFPVLVGDAKLGEQYGGVFGLPVTFLIDRRGIVRRRIEGEQKLDWLEQQVETMLADTKR